MEIPNLDEIAEILKSKGIILRDSKSQFEDWIGGTHKFENGRLVVRHRTYFYIARVLCTDSNYEDSIVRVCTDNGIKFSQEEIGRIGGSLGNKLYMYDLPKKVENEELLKILKWTVQDSLYNTNIENRIRAVNKMKSYSYRDYVIYENYVVRGTWFLEYAKVTIPKELIEKNLHHNGWYVFNSKEIDEILKNVDWVEINKEKMLEQYQ